MAVTETDSIDFLQTLNCVRVLDYNAAFTKDLHKASVVTVCRLNGFPSTLYLTFGKIEKVSDMNRSTQITQRRCDNVKVTLCLQNLKIYLQHRNTRYYAKGNIRN